MTTINRHQTASGHVLSSSSWLDAHFEACRAEYSAILACLRFGRVACVLDAGCGSFLPSLEGVAEEVVAIEPAPEHLRAIGEHTGRSGDEGCAR